MTKIWYQYSKILHVTQGIVTPDATMISKSKFPFKSPKSLLDLGVQVTPALIDWINEWQDLDLNIIICDHYHKTNFVQAIYELNQKQLLSNHE